MVSSLTAAVPAHWATALRPFLQSADEFDAVEPPVAFFLRTHAAHLALQRRCGDDDAGSVFLRRLVGDLEAERRRLGALVDAVDGRTALTRAALAVFARADEAERSGEASMTVVRLFATAALLFEATAQFSADGRPDEIAAQRRDYARYIAVRMKRAIAAGTPYESPNKNDNNNNNNNNIDSNDNRDGDNNNNNNNKEKRQRQDELHTQYTPSPPQPATPPPAHTYTAPMTIKNEKNNNKNISSNSGTSSGGGGETAAGGPSMDAMINAQKCAKQAVSALQFYDHVTARKQLIAALNLLGGK